jgi:hypothetical protein
MQQDPAKGAGRLRPLENSGNEGKYPPVHDGLCRPKRTLLWISCGSKGELWRRGAAKGTFRLLERSGAFVSPDHCGFVERREVHRLRLGGQESHQNGVAEGEVRDAPPVQPSVEHSAAMPSAGGFLSHGAIIARELGVPAVLMCLSVRPTCRDRGQSCE